MQSMGLGSVANREGAFGDFQGDAPVRRPAVGPGDRRAALTRPSPSPSARRSSLTIPAVCLNYGLPTPTPRDTLTLMDVDEYTTDPRIRKALRSLATYGTSHGVAQAVMWRVCNDLPFETMVEQAGKVMNPSRDRPGRAVRRGPRRVERRRIWSTRRRCPSRASSSRCEGEGALAREAQRLTGQLDGPPRAGPSAQGRRIRDAARLLGPGARPAASS